jgi:two-component system, sporulation sensor kinase A
METFSKEMEYVEIFLNQLTDAVMLVTPEMKIAAVNKKFKELTGEEEISIGQSVTEILTRISKEQGTLLAKDGLVYVEIEEGQLPFAGKLFPYYLLKKRANTSLLTQEMLFKTLMDIVPDFIGIKDGNGRFVFANEFVRELFELQDVSFPGKTDADLAVISPFFHEVFQYCIETDEKVWQEQKIVRCEEYVPSRDGRTRVFDVYKIPVFNEDGSRKNLLVFGREVTEKIESTMRLEESEARYRLLAENSMDMITTHNPDGTFTYVSPASITLLGRKPEEMVGTTGYGMLHPDDEEATRRGHEKLLHGPATATVQFRLKHEDGHYVWLETSCKSIVDENGEVVEIIGVTRDISERKKSEELLRQSDKLSIVGQLAASIAHEIRNPLTSLKGFVQLFQENERSGVSDYYTIMHNELNRIDQIMGQLLLLAKPQAKTYKKTSLKELMRFVITLLKPEARIQNVDIETEINDDLPDIIAEENELKQVLINVIKNAMDSMAEGGRILIKGITEDKKILLAVQDQGCGIPADRLKKIGEPFYTTKEKGTGLGLMVSLKIMKEHRGDIQFHSTEGQGTTVVLTLPVQ